MSTTTERSPESDEGRGRGGAAGAAGRPSRLIHSEATTEIPVHLLFRDDPRDPAGVALPSAVVRGGAARPRVEPGARADAARPSVPLPPPVPVPGADPELAERRARVLPGAVGVLAGGVGAAGCVLALWWAGVLPRALPGAPGRAGARGIGAAQWAVLAGAGALALFGFGGLARGRVGGAWVLTLFGRYRGSVRRTGLLWVNPLLLRRRVDVRLRHWRSEPMAAVDRSGVALRVVVLVVWRVRDAARAALAVADHQEYLRECVEATAARVLSRLPADAFHDGARGAADGGPTLRDAEAVGEALTRALAAQAEPVGIEVFSVQPTRIEYAPEVAEAMHRRRIAALDARHRDSVLTSVVDSVEDTVTRLTTRGLLVELDDYERKALVKDLTVAFCTGHGER
ncbi:SPFH domain-containing protein [Streptomyces sp. AN091965]|uniref:SPFH domain-containing protein n=1 Tax=Streptomyces sp. AN091965 TaxID=2927803 RepID=UPI001F619BF6|nr:SPFH domain-containing protein [Streptomyces sp. AN091965]MCI3930887.1 SPFH domain-containing protein [Streptomyces sp. AN091965]